MKNTLCWDCNKTCGGCSWTRASMPVKGWTAKKRYIKANVGHERTYMVIRCPEFTPLKCAKAKTQFYDEYLVFKKNLDKFSNEERSLLELYYTLPIEEVLKTYKISQRTMYRRVAKIREKVKILQQCSRII